MPVRCKKGWINYNNLITVITQVPGRVVPPNQCGVHFDGFYPEQFGEWEFWTSTMNTKSAGKTASIETVEGPCEDMINSDLKPSKGQDYQSLGKSFLQSYFN